MNIETANRLLQYRKRNNLSQEELAEKIGVSRQAVSKWERAEASPDTDNLIELAKIYGITLDELISGASEEEENSDKNDGNKKSINLDFNNGKKVKVEFTDGDNKSADNTAEGGEETKNDNCPPKTDHISFKNGIHVHSKDGDRVDIGLTGVHVHDKNGDKVDVGWNGVFVEEKGEQTVYTDENGNVVYNEKYKKREGFKNICHAIPFVPLVIIAYLLFGFTGICGGWAAGWLIFLTIPIYYSLIDAIYKGNPNHFAYPVLVVFVYLFFGMFYGLWHPYWILFLTVPLYYCVADIIKNGGKHNRHIHEEHSNNRNQ